MTITTCIFDAYGTLFDVSAAAREAAGEPGNEALSAVWPQLARDWRDKQLQYTWLRAITGAHCDFWQVTQDGLDWAMEAAGLSDPALRALLLTLYEQLSAYPEVPATLRALKAAGLNTAILSNGSPDMLASAVNSAGIGEFLDDVLSVESVSVFKPHSAVYGLVEPRFSCTRDQVLFVSSNGWDAAGATGFGFHTAWVNRANAPTDRLPWTPGITVNNLTSISEVAAGI